MTVPQITDFSDAPNPDDGPTVFDAAMRTFFTELGTFVTEANTQASYSNTQAAASAASATAAASSATDAATSATAAATSATAAATSASTAATEVSTASASTIAAAQAYAEQAAAAAGAVAWASGSDQSAGDLVISPSDGAVYRAVSDVTGGTTDPASDATNFEEFLPSLAFGMRSFATYADLMASDFSALASEDDLVYVRDIGATYQVAASGATDQHLTTAGGVKLYALPTAAGHFNFAAWAPAGDGATDDTAKLQNAMDHAHDNNADLFIPSGVYLVTGLTIPGTVTGTDERGKAFRIFGQGYGEPFVVNGTDGTTIKSVTDAPVLADILDTDPSSNGTFVLENIRLDGTSSSDPVLKLQSFYGLSAIRRVAVYQRGEGDGIEITYSATTEIDQAYVMNGDWATASASRTGTGVLLNTTYDAGLVRFRGITSRGWALGFDIGSGAGQALNPLLDSCECSYTENGIKLGLNAKNAMVVNCYLEGGDGGTGILDLGDYSTILGCCILPGYGVGIDATSTSAKGTVLSSNTVSIGALEDAIGIDVTSSSPFGGYNKTVRGNRVVYTLGTSGVSGIRFSGTDPRLSVIDNSFDPRGAWTGTDTNKIVDASVNGAMGIVQAENGAYEVPVLSRGAFSLFSPDASLTEADVSSNVLTLGAGSFFRVEATVSTTVNSLDVGDVSGRFIILRTINSNMTIADTAQIILAGSTNFTGPGTLTLIVERSGGTTYAYEVARSVS